MKTLVCLLMIWQCCVAGNILFYSALYNEKRSDVALVLGAAVWGDQPSPVFEQRIKQAINLYNQGYADKILFTGGVGEGGKFAESVVAFNYAVLKGISSADILIETKSKTTLGNLVEAKKLLGTKRLNSVLLVSDPLHMRRAMTMAEDFGIDALASPTQTSRYVTLFIQLRFLLREMYFLQRYNFFGY